MVTPSVGAIVLIPFPFSDLTNAKLRPAFVVAESGKDDWVCVQITSNPYADAEAIKIKESDFKTGSLQRVSYVRPGKLFTAGRIIFKRKIGMLADSKVDEIKESIINIIQSGK
ncbi:type II toxin-antitoxin system PemK/MazF family toxin [Candidatus Venteria ishoeyi]|uniref:PemK-like protein n=1 Tax=Candidatus Venteria ishoeyi TaxID=1899563 RepID=A0A1H6FDC3_9GAMM|nr:type II toxin-antitoxin system PemK/MazF family toxin [Candidatus Venteria ishoeyi]MDM8546459.1 type II toxin-antitoxin system PemK/MazF family toxin [Candidatus Venteria ishoeyi]SEH08090.1 PemK-like protein [Candidatus Venteria ishoeyi]